MVELAVIIPTLNEYDNVPVIIDRIDTALQGIEWEAIFVDDDSEDGTSDYIRRISLQHPRVRVLQRIGRSGLASACIEGMLATAAPYLAVMDADLQHDESILPRMLETLKQQDFDVVVGSRNVVDGSMGNLAPRRKLLSRMGGSVCAMICKCEVADPMSGYFVLRRSFLEAVVHRLSGIGFKILVDLLASSSRPVKLKELPYHFRSRQFGVSKLDFSTGLEYLLLLSDKIFGDFLPARYLIFGGIGCLGAMLYLVVLRILYRGISLPFTEATAIAAGLTMLINFMLNNALTFRNVRLHGWNLVKGLLTFYIACTVGLVANIALAEFCIMRGLPWYLAAVFGLIVGSVWNFAVTNMLTWRRLRRQARRFAADVLVSQENLPQQQSRSASL